MQKTGHANVRAVRLVEHTYGDADPCIKVHNLSQENLSEMIGISVTHMSHIETGNTKLSLQVLVDLAIALEVRTDDLLYDKSFAERNTAIEAIVQILDTCTTQQIRVIEDIIKATKTSLSQHF